MNNDLQRQKGNRLKVFVIGFIIVSALTAVLYFRRGLLGFYKDIMTRYFSSLTTADHPSHLDNNKTSSIESKNKKILYYRSSMDPTQIYDKPGKDSMGMEVIPVYEDDISISPKEVRIDPLVVQNIGVRTMTIAKKRLNRTIRTVGRVDYNEKGVTNITTKIGGWVERLYINFTGQEVKEGDILLEIYSPELVSTQEEYLLALRYKDTLSKGQAIDVAAGALSLLESTKKRLQLLDVAPHQIEELEKTREIKRTLHIHSPVKGIVVEKNVKEGMFVKPGMSLYTIADISTVWVYADIYEYEIPWLREGQNVEMTLSYSPGRIYKGKVGFIYPYLEPKTRTLKVRLEFPNPAFELKPEMFANVKIESPVAINALIVPIEAVIHSGERRIVILSKGEGRFEPVEITIGLQTEEYYEVLSGLKEKDTIVTSSNFLIDSESRLKEAINKMVSERQGVSGLHLDMKPEGNKVSKSATQAKADVKPKTVDHSKHTGSIDDGEMDMPNMNMDATQHIHND